jgi:hypothetical protein
MRFNYQDLIQIAIKEICRCYKEKAPCYNCIVRPCCSSFCEEADKFLKNRGVGYVFDSDTYIYKDPDTGETTVVPRLKKYRMAIMHNAKVTDIIEF